MKPSLLCLFCVIFLGLSFSAPASEDNKDEKDEKDDIPIRLIEYTNTRTNDTFDYKYYLTDGTSQVVKGTLKDVNGTKVFTIKGQYTWEIEEDLKLVVEYEADENGYRIVKIYAFSTDRFIDGKAIGSLLG